MKLRLMLVDDEPTVLKGLRTIIERSNENWDILGEYKNGAEALEAITRLNPDVVITDIKMPVMGGLEFVEQARTVNPRIKFIILSGFADFTYAQQSIRLETVDYILKPPRFQDILDSIKKAERLKRENEEAAQLLKENRLRGYIHGEETAAVKQETEAPEESRIFYSRFALFMIKLDDFSFFVLDGVEDKLKKLTFLREEIRKAVYKRSGCLLDLYDGRYVCFLNVTNGSPVYLKGLAREILKELNETVGESMTIGVSRAFESPDSLKSAYKECLQILRDKVFHEKNSIIHIEEVGQGKNPDDYPLEMEQRYIEYLMFADLKRAGELLRQITGRFIEVSGRNPAVFKCLIAEFVMAVTRKLAESAAVDVFNEMLGKDVYDKLNSLDNIDSVNELLLNLTKSVTDYFAERNKPGCRKIINEIKAFIQNNYFVDITLKQVANDFFINESYLSELFKKEAGSPFIVYLTRVRMEHAKRLLCQKDLKAKDIAEMVGYSNDWYFCKVFKNYTGKTPIEYKESISSFTS